MELKKIANLNQLLKTAAKPYTKEYGPGDEEYDQYGILEEEIHETKEGKRIIPEKEFRNLVELAWAYALDVTDDINNGGQLVGDAVDGFLDGIYGKGNWEHEK